MEGGVEFHHGHRFSRVVGSGVPDKVGRLAQSLGFYAGAGHDPDGKRNKKKEIVAKRMQSQLHETARPMTSGKES